MAINGRTKRLSLCSDWHKMCSRIDFIGQNKYALEWHLSVDTDLEHVRSTWQVSDMACILHASSLRLSLQQLAVYSLRLSGPQCGATLPVSIYKKRSRDKDQNEKSQTKEFKKRHRDGGKERKLMTHSNLKLVKREASGVKSRSSKPSACKQWFSFASYSSA